MARPVLALVGLLAALLPAGGARAEVVSERPDSVAVTAYRDPGGRGENYWDDWSEGLDSNDGLVLVTETRTVDVPAGRAKISFRGVAEGIIPQTAAIEGLPSAMLERNHDYDLLSPGALVAKSVGKRVRLVRTNRFNGEVTEETAIVRSGPRGVVLDYGGGRIEAVNCSGWPERLVFEEAPDGLADRPTLSVVTNAAQAGRHQVRLSYLAFGLKWAADYVARIHPDGRRLDLTGWITLSNRSATSFVDAPTQVVAGELSRDDETAPPAPVRVYRTPSCWQMDTTTRVARPPLPPPPEVYAPAAPGMVEALIVTGQTRQESLQDVPIAISAFEGELGDYKLYTLPEPTTVAARQTKQVMMLHQEDVPFERLYVHDLRMRYYDSQGDASASTITLRLTNTAAKGLGRALPGGRVAVMAPYGEAALLAGEDSFGDVPVGLPFDVEVGRTMEVRAIETTLREWRIEREGGTLIRREHEVALANNKPEPVTLELRLEADRYTLLSASRRHGRRYGDLTWTIRLKPGERQVLRYATESRW